jgi:hypothetical protein
MSEEHIIDLFSVDTAIPDQEQFDPDQLHQLYRGASAASTANSQHWLTELYHYVSKAPPGPLRQALDSAVREDLGRAAVARHGGADPDRADYKDTLGKRIAASSVSENFCVSGGCLKSPPGPCLSPVLGAQ